MSEKYMPDESALIATYWDAKARQVDNPQTSEIVAEAGRGIAKIKADALRGAAGDLIREAALIPMPTSDHPAVRALRERADRIEAES